MFEKLSERELEILSLLADGKTNREIADSLYLSLGTVKAHNHNIYQKLGVTSRVQALLQAQELGLLPDPDTKEATSSSDVAQEPVSPSSVPTHFTPFVGREHELTQIKALLAANDTRLLTILGPGGIGKTRLAVELSLQETENYEDGVYFVSLTRVAEAKEFAPVILYDMGLRYQQSVSPEEQLIAYLRDKNVLLILDNFEHMIDMAPFVADLLMAAPNVQVLTTSRERLNLSHEVVYLLSGLQVSDRDFNYAAELLVRCIELQDPTYIPRADDERHIKRICELTDGMPLALVLAASWVQMLPLAEIADEISQGIDILETQMRDIPARQRSMRAITESSWARLTPRQQGVFAKLSVFHSGFTREAARAVAGATLRDLQVLVHRSLLLVVDQRFEIHELLRQFAYEKLFDNPESLPNTIDAHTRYYINFLAEKMPDLWVGDQFGAANDIEADLDNIRAAIGCAVATHDTTMLHRGIQGAYTFFELSGRFKESVEIAEAVAEQYASAEDIDEVSLRVSALAEMAWLYARFARIKDARTAIEEADAMYKAHGLTGENIFARSNVTVAFAFVELMETHMERATELAEQALENDPTPYTYALAYYILSSIAYSEGRYAKTLADAQQSYDTAYKAGHRWFTAYALINMAEAEFERGHDDRALAYAKKAHDLRAQINDPEGISMAAQMLGQVAFRRGNYAEAEVRFRESLKHARTTGDTGRIINALRGLGDTFLRQHRFSVARGFLLQALELSRKTALEQYTLRNLHSISRLLLAEGRHEDAAALASFLLAYPNTQGQLRGFVHETRDELSERDRWVEESPYTTLDEAVAAAQMWLGVPASLT